VTDQKQQENAAYFNYLGSLTSDASCVRENISRILVVKAAFNKKKTHFITKLDLNLRGRGVRMKCYVWSTADQKYLGSFEMWWWRRMEKFSWTDNVKNAEVLLRVQEERNILNKIRQRKNIWIGHILPRNCLRKCY